jgi:hypothetical protein
MEQIFYYYILIWMRLRKTKLQLILAKIKESPKYHIAPINLYISMSQSLLICVLVNIVSLNIYKTWYGTLEYMCARSCDNHMSFSAFS